MIEMIKSGLSKSLLNINIQDFMLMEDKHAQTGSSAITYSSKKTMSI